MPKQDRSVSGRGFVKEGPRSPSVIGGALPRAHDQRPRRLRTVDGHVIRAAARAHECQSDQPSRIPAPLIDPSLPRGSPSRPLDTRSLHVSRVSPTGRVLHHQASAHEGLDRPVYAASAAAFSWWSDFRTPGSKVQPSSSSTNRPRHPGGKLKSQPYATRVRWAATGVAVIDAALWMPSGMKSTSKPTWWRSGSTTRTTSRARRVTPSAEVLDSSTCPGTVGPGGVMVGRRRSDHSPYFVLSMRIAQTLSTGASTTAAGQTLTTARA